MGFFFKILTAYGDKIALAKGMLFKLFLILFYRRQIKVGRKLRIYGPFPILHASRGGRITIGSNLVVRNSTRHNYIGVHQRTSIIACGKGEIRIGENVGISGANICAHKLIIIGSYTLIGANASLFDSDFHPLEPDSRMRSLTGNRNEPVGIGEVHLGTNCFVGYRAILLKNVTVGDGAVIGAASIVAGKTIPANQIWSGNPARFVKKL